MTEANVRSRGFRCMDAGWEMIKSEAAKHGQTAGNFLVSAAQAKAGMRADEAADCLDKND